MKNQAQLIAYVDRLSGGTFRQFQQLLAGPLQGLFGGVHVLPFFHPIDGADAGFDPIDHTQVDPRLGTWDDVAALAAETEVMADLIVNHVSSRSPQFADFDQRGLASPYAGMFLTYDRVFGAGARESDLLALHTPRPHPPFTKHRTAHGDDVLLWTTFTSEQVDIDVHHPEGRRYLESVLDRFGAAGIKAIRLDAIGFAVKKAGTSCFMIPETFSLIADITAQAHARGMEVLVEVHGHHQDQIAVASHVDWVYDFALPPLVLHALFARDATPLCRWLGIRPANAVTVLDTHDGIGVQDVDADPRRPGFGLLPPQDIHALVETIHERSGGESRQASGTAAGNVDVHQINCTFYDALGRRDEEYLIARAIQCFVPGIPQIYYVGLLAGGNDMALLRRTSVGRDLNRHYYVDDEVARALDRPVVRTLCALLRFRGSHPSFGGMADVSSPAADQLVLEWRNGADRSRLDIDLGRMRASIVATQEGGPSTTLVWTT